MCLAYVALCLWVLGFPEQALQWSQRAVAGLPGTNVALKLPGQRKPTKHGDRANARYSKIGRADIDMIGRAQFGRSARRPVDDAPAQPLQRVTTARWAGERCTSIPIHPGTVTPIRPGPTTFFSYEKGSRWRYILPLIRPPGS